MDLNQKFFLVKNVNEINKKLYELIEKPSYKNKNFSKRVANKKLVLYFAYLFGLRISEALIDLSNLYVRLEQKTDDGVKYYNLRSVNLKNKEKKEKYITFIPYDEYENKMWAFIENNYYAGITKNLTRYSIVKFCKRHLIDTFIGYDKKGYEVVQISYLNPHTLRHLRAYVLLERCHDPDLIRRMLGWADERMLYYYTRLAKSIEEKEIERKVLSYFKKQKVKA